VKRTKQERIKKVNQLPSGAFEVAKRGTCLVTESHEACGQGERRKRQPRVRDVDEEEKEKEKKSGFPPFSFPFVYHCLYTYTLSSSLFMSLTNP
jgi:hypothetical protein